MILYIDGTDYNSVTYGLTGKGGSTMAKSYKVDPHRSHESLSYLEKFLKTAKIKPGEIKKIVVNKGPGSFTGTRIGIAHAMALGLAWRVPVKAVAKEKFIVK